VIDPRDEWLRREERAMGLRPGPEQAALLLLNAILREAPQALDCFDVYNPMIQDRDHNCVMLDMMPLAGLPRGGFKDARKLEDFVGSMEGRQLYVQRPTLRERGDGGRATAAMWKPLRQEVLSWLKGENAAFYRIVGSPQDLYQGATKPTVYAQFQSQIEWSEWKEGRSEVIGLMLRVFKAIRARDDSLSRLESFWVDGAGHMRYYAVIHWPIYRKGEPADLDVEVRRIERGSGD
jgi:hypothetical protein